MNAVLLTLSIGVLAVGVPLSAHHSFAADYFEERTDFWWPWHVPSLDLNLIYATNITIR